MKRLLINKFYGGISNDKNIGGVGTVMNIENIDVHSDSKKVRLSKTYNYFHQINTRYDGEIIASLYEQTSTFLELSKDGYLTYYGSGEVDKYDLYGCNLGKITIGSGQTYGFAISKSSFVKWLYDGSSSVLGYFNMWGGLNPDENMNNDGGWTLGAGWSFNSGLQHTPGNTASTTRNLSPVSGTRYRIYINGYASTGSCQIKMGGQTIITITPGGSQELVGFRTATSNSELLEFVPSSNYDGKIFKCYINSMNNITTSYNFNQKAPYVINLDDIYIGNGNKITKVTMTTGNPIITDVFTINKDYTIVGITKIGDQFFVYASNGSNGKQYIWDGYDTVASRVITWVDKPIQNVANFANTDYVIVGNNSRQQLCIVNGYQLQPVIVTDDYTTQNGRIYFNSSYINSVETFGNRLLFGGNGCIYSFGNKTPGLPQALLKEWTYPGNSLTNIFYDEKINYSIYAHFKGTLNYSNQTGIYGNYKIQIYLREGENNEQFTNISSTRSTGWIETQPIYGECFSNVKKLVKYTFGAKIPQYTFINIYKEELENEKYAILYNVLGIADLNLQIGDTYSYDGRIFTIEKIIGETTRPGILLYCSYTGNKLTGKPKGLFTKLTGNGPNNLYIDTIRYGYKLVGTFRNTNNLRHSGIITGEFYKTQIAIELGSFDLRKTPELYDFNLYFDENTND